MNTITPSEMIAWFKSKSLEFASIAQVLEQTFNANGQPIVGQSTVVQIPQPVLDLSEVKKALSKLANARVGEVVKELSRRGHQNVDWQIVKTMMESNSDHFEVKGRGWWSVKA